VTTADTPLGEGHTTRVCHGSIVLAWLPLAGREHLPAAKVHDSRAAGGLLIIKSR
jgi:putative intracellular protease/amidase